MLRGLVLLVAATAALATAPRGDVAAHAQLGGSVPAQDALLSAPPRQISLLFTEPVDISAVVVTAVDQEGAAVVLEPPTLDPANDRRVLTRSDGFSIGTYTVSWTNRSVTDGHTITGSFAFRVGGTDRAPAAATVEGQRPPAWGVVTRWLAFLGAAGGAALLIAAADDRRRRLVAVGLAVGLLATLAEPVLLSRFPPAGSQGGSVGDALRAAPNGWWARAIGLTLALVAGAAPLAPRRRRELLGGAALLAVGGLSLSSHAAGRETYALGALMVTFVHNASVALWVGALALIAIAPLRDRWAELRQFARRALPLAAVAVATGVGSAVLILPSWASLLDSDYGRVVLAKATVVAAILALAAYHHRAVGRLAQALPTLMRRSVRVELGLAAVAVALASTMAMLATPRISQGELERLELAMPTSREMTFDQAYVRLDIDPARTGVNELTAYATQGPPVRVELDAAGGPVRIEAPPLTDVQAMRVEVVSLNHALAPRSSEMTPLGDGRFTGGGVNFSVDGWWRARVTVRRAGVAEDAVGEVFLRTPDPNVAGFEETAGTASDPAAEQLFRRARAQFEAQPWVVQQEALSSSEGASVVSELAWADGVTTISSSGFDVIRSGGQRYTRQDGGAWTMSKDAPVTGPDDWATEFDGATNFQLGIQEEIDGALCQVVTFYVPASNLTPAFYTLWVDVETGQIEQLAMDSVKHFMLKRYDWSAKPTPVALPAV